MLSNRRSLTRSSARWISSHSRSTSQYSDSPWRTGSLANRHTSLTASTPEPSPPVSARPRSAPRSNARYRRVTIGLFQLLQPDVAELHAHRVADVHLKADEAVLHAILQVVVHDHARPRAVQDL